MDFISENEVGNPENQPAQKKCESCGAANLQQNRFCKSCGKPLKSTYQIKKAKGEGATETTLYSIIAFFVALVLIIGLNGYSNMFNPTFENSIVVDCIMAVLVLGFSIGNRMELAKLFNPKYVNASRALILSLIMVGFAVVVHLLANAINRQLFDTDMVETSVYHQTQWPLLFCILFIGVYPAIFEELAFRGFLFNQLLRFTNPRSVIIITGILFAFMHFAFIGLLWYIPIGLFWGYLRFRYRTIWYGMLCHFVYNTTIVVMEFMGG
jgi:uncharacterized protein